MSNATAVLGVRSFGGVAPEWAIDHTTASGALAGRLGGEFGDLGAEETNRTRSRAGVGLDWLRQELLFRRVTASVRDITDVARASQVPVRGWKDEACEVIQGLAALQDGWDGPCSAAATNDAVEIAGAMIREWPSDLPRPELDLHFDGSLVFELFDAKGFALASIETKADGTVAYVVASGTEILVSARETDASHQGIERVFRSILDRIA